MLLKLFLPQVSNQREHACNPLGFCLRVIVNENPLNFEKTTSSVLSVLLFIYNVLKLLNIQQFDCVKIPPKVSYTYTRLTLTTLMKGMNFAVKV